MNYDEKILECIKSKYKTVKEISEETGISYNRVNIRMKSLRKSECVVYVQGKSDSPGIKPTKYKKSIS